VESEIINSGTPKGPKRPWTGATGVLGQQFLEQLLRLEFSGVTPKPATRGHLKTRHFERDGRVIGSWGWSARENG